MREDLAITSAEYLDGYRLKLSCCDGHEQETDFHPILTNSGQSDVRKYLDVEQFKQFKVFVGGLEWNDLEMCFSTESLYGETVINETLFDWDKTRDVLGDIFNPTYDFTNIAPEDHLFGVDVKLHVPQPEDQFPGIRPFVKFFRHDWQRDFITVALDPDPDRVTVTGRGEESPVTVEEENRLLAKVKTYRVPLWNMYYDSGMTQCELLRQIGEVD